MRTPKDITRADAIRLIDYFTDCESAGWEQATDEFYDEENDRLPSIYDYMEKLGISKEEYDCAVKGAAFQGKSPSRQMKQDELQELITNATDILMLNGFQNIAVIGSYIDGDGNTQISERSDGNVFANLGQAEQFVRSTYQDLDRQKDKG